MKSAYSRSKNHKSGIRLAFVALILLSSTLLPITAQAGRNQASRDPIWNARLKNIPEWLRIVDAPNELYSEFQLPILAGRLINFATVDAQGCPQRGLQASGEANECGVRRALDATLTWQNQFNTALVQTGQQTGVPPRLLKNIFAWESQFWPQSAFVNTYEYGLGHITLGGADSVLRWNPPFYDTICASSFNAETCRTKYIDQPAHIRSALMGVVLQRANPDCPECRFYLDLNLAERSIPIFAETLLANASFVKQTIKARTGREAADVFEYEDLWKFTLTSYNAGPGCFANALITQVNYHLRLDWETFAAQLEPGCRGAVPYIDFVSNTDQYFPDHDPSRSVSPSATLPPVPTPTAGQTGETITPPSITTIPPETTSTPITTTPTEPITSEPAPTSSGTLDETITPERTPTLQDETSTPVETPGVTPFPRLTRTPIRTFLPPRHTLTPTPTVIPSLTPSTTEPSPTPTPIISMTPGEITSTPTPTPTSTLPSPSPTGAVSATPTINPTPELTLTATVTVTPTLTATPVVTITSTLVPTPTAVVEPIVEPHSSTQIILQLNSENSEIALRTLQSLGIDLDQDSITIEPLDALVVQVPSENLSYVLAVLQDTPGIIYAEPDYLVSTAGLTSDPLLFNQENLALVQVPQAWEALPSMREVVVAVVDTGVDVTHPDLVDNIWQNAGETGMDADGKDKRNNGVDDDDNGFVDDWQGWNTISNNNQVIDGEGHGTHLAGIIGAPVNNLVGIAGVAPNARLLPIKAINNAGVGTYSQVAKGIIYATDMGARIINLGFTGAGYSTLLQQAIDYAVSHDVLVIAASGNDGGGAISYPAGYDGALAVSAVDNDGYWSGFSSYGSHVYLSAPGVEVFSTGLGGTYLALSGTSMAAAHVSGIAALLAGQPQFGNLSDLRVALEKSAIDRGDPGKDVYFGHGIVQAYSALVAGGAIQPSRPTPTPTLASAQDDTRDTNNTAATEELWGRSQIASSAISNAANSIDGAFNDLLASSTGPYGASNARRWTFTTLDDTSLTTVAATYLDLRLYFSGWMNDAYTIQVYEPTKPGCTLGWCTVMTLKLNPTGASEALPPTSLTTLSVTVTSLLNTPAKVNNAQVRLAGLTAVDGVADLVTIYLDEVRLRVLDVLPPTPTPSPTPIFIPTATIPSTRAPTAIPMMTEPHSNFSGTTDQCASCHRPHTAKTTNLRSKATEEQVCFACHTAGGIGTNVQPSFTIYNNTLERFFTHAVSDKSAIHNPDESIGSSFGGTNRHVECEDCHSPHTSARSATPGANPAPAAQQEVYQSTGVDPVWTAAGAPTSYTWLETAEREYQICLKCHSSFTTLPTYKPDGYGYVFGSITPVYISNGLAKLTSINPAQVHDSRDLAKEFNSYQVSFHPVAAQGRNINMPAGGFVAPWTQSSILYCTDCHDNADGTTDGPHGSPLLHLLDGSAEYVTKTDPSQSCSFGECPTVHDPGELCFKCHQYGTYATDANPESTTNFRRGSQNLHAFHSFGSCYACHDSHGSEQDHLINFDTSVVSITIGYNSQTAYQVEPGTKTVSCYVACHDGDHGLDPDRQYVAP